MMLYENRITRAPFGTLLLLMSFGVTNATFLSPALPAIAAYFALTSNQAQKVIIFYLAGYALSQLFYGPFTKRFGRKFILVLGMNVTVLATLLCMSGAHMHRFDLLLVGRTLAGCGAGVCLEIAFTLAHDLYPAEERHRVLSYLLIGFSIFPGFAIAINGWIIHFFGWTSCFLFILSYTFFVLVLSYFKLPDMDSIENKTVFKTEGGSPYFQVLKHPSLWQGGIFLGLMSAIPYVFSIAGPFIGINELGLKESHYGTLVLSLTCASVLGGVTSGQLSHHHLRRYFFSIALVLLSFALICLFIGLRQEHFLVSILFGSMMFMYFSYSFIAPMASSLVMKHTPDIAHGTALMNFLRILIALIALIAANAIPVNRVTFTWYYVCLIGIAWLIYFSLVIAAHYHKRWLKAKKAL